MSTIACDCGQLACVTCDDAYDHPDRQHCSDPRCIAACPTCQQAAVDEHADRVAADLALTECER